MYLEQTNQVSTDKQKKTPEENHIGQKRPNSSPASNNNAFTRGVSIHPKGILKNQNKEGLQRTNKHDKTNNRN